MTKRHSFASSHPQEMHAMMAKALSNFLSTPAGELSPLAFTQPLPHNLAINLRQAIYRYKWCAVKSLCKPFDTLTPQQLQEMNAELTRLKELIHPQLIPWHFQKLSVTVEHVSPTTSRLAVRILPVITLEGDAPTNPTDTTTKTTEDLGEELAILHRAGLA